MWRLQINASQNSVTLNATAIIVRIVNNHLIIIIISIITITYHEERKIQAVTVMRVRMWATSPWGGHSSWYALDIRGLFSQYDIEKKRVLQIPLALKLKEIIHQDVFAPVLLEVRGCLCPRLGHL